MAFSPDGDTIAAGTQDGKVLLWDWRGDEEPREIDVCHDPRGTTLILSLAFSPDGAELAVGAYVPDKPSVYIVKRSAPV